MLGICPPLPQCVYQVLYFLFSKTAADVQYLHRWGHQLLKQTNKKLKHQRRENSGLYEPHNCWNWGLDLALIWWLVRFVACGLFFRHGLVHSSVAFILHALQIAFVTAFPALTMRTEIEKQWLLQFRHRVCRNKNVWCSNKGQAKQHIHATTHVKISQISVHRLKKKKSTFFKDKFSNDRFDMLTNYSHIVYHQFLLNLKNVLLIPGYYTNYAFLFLLNVSQ